MTLPLQDAYVVKLDIRLMPASPTHLLGTDELGRDFFSRFVAGSEYTVLTGLMTTLLAGVSGWLLRRAAQAAPIRFGRLVVILAHICFIAPSFLLAPRWLGRLLMIVLSLFSALPLFIITLIVIGFGKLSGVAASFALGPLFGVGIAYIISRDDCLSSLASEADGRSQFLRLVALTAPVFAWSAYFLAILDILGLGVQPPRSSWGNMLGAQSISSWPQAAAGLGFLVIGMTAFTFSNAIARGQNETLNV
ncbi:hypothetical protein ACQZ6F_09875 [Rhizobium sp. A22-96]